MTEEEIFAAAAALPAEEWAAYLGSACAGQPEVRAPVETLLRSHDASGCMDQATGAVAGAESLPKCENSLVEQTGARIGRYRLLQQIGESGFGVVWMAEQVEPMTRRVALKIIKAGRDTREVIARFEAERQAAVEDWRLQAWECNRQLPPYSAAIVSQPGGHRRRNLPQQ